MTPTNPRQKVEALLAEIAKKRRANDGWLDVETGQAEDLLRALLSDLTTKEQEIASLTEELRLWRECAASVSEHTPQGWAEYTGKVADEAYEMRQRVESLTEERDRLRIEREAFAIESEDRRERVEALEAENARLRAEKGTQP